VGAALAAWVLPANPSAAQCVTGELQKVVASDGEGWDDFGAAVALEGNVAVIGAWSYRVHASGRLGRSNLETVAIF
jgi:hypothetical protein